MKRSLGAQDPYFEPGVSNGCDTQAHGVGAAPRRLRQREQARQRSRKRNQIEAAINHRAEHDIASGSQVVKRGR